MRNFRPNIVVRGARAFEEDHWRRVVIGDTELAIVKPCSRCSIVTINTATGKYSADMQPNRALKTFHASEDKPYFGQNAVQLAPSGLRIEVVQGVLTDHRPRGCRHAAPRRALLTILKPPPMNFVKSSRQILLDEIGTFSHFGCQAVDAHDMAAKAAVKAPGGGRTVNSDR